MGSCASIYRNSVSASKQLRMSFVPSKTDKHSIASTPVKTAAVAQLSPFDSVTSFHYQSSAGSREETFFDSRAWLESDCDDFYSANGDFTPSRGSTPVHGSAAGSPRVLETFSLPASKALCEGRTPLNSESAKPPGGALLHQSVSADTSGPLVSKAAVEGKAFWSNTNALSSSSPDKKRKLLDLFRESRGGGYDEGLPISGYLSENDGNRELEMMPDVPRSAHGTPDPSGSKSASIGERTPTGDCKLGKEKPLKSAQCCFLRLVPSRSFHDKKKPTTPSATVDA